jgi:hypothetical protein
LIRLCQILTQFRLQLQKLSPNFPRSIPQVALLWICRRFPVASLLQPSMGNAAIPSGICHFGNLHFLTILARYLVRHLGPENGFGNPDRMQMSAAQHCSPFWAKNISKVLQVFIGHSFLAKSSLKSLALSKGLVHTIQQSRKTVIPERLVLKIKPPLISMANSRCRIHTLFSHCIFDAHLHGDCTESIR